jgi:hypothetical protein
VNEHSFILNDSPQDGKKYRRTAEWEGEEPRETLPGAYRRCFSLLSVA